MVSRTARASAVAAEGTNAKVNNTATGVGGRPPGSRRSERICSYNRILYPMYPPSERRSDGERHQKDTFSRESSEEHRMYTRTGSSFPKQMTRATARARRVRRRTTDSFIYLLC